MASLPAKFLINSVEMIDNNSYVSSDTRNLIYLQRKTVGQRYEFRIRSIELDQLDIKSIMAGIAAIERANDVLTLTLPIFSQSNATTKTAAEALAIGAFKCDLVGASGVEVGDFFKFAGHSKAYQVTEVTADEITFSPNVIRPVTNGEQLQFNGVPFTCKIRGRPQRFNVDADRNSAVIELDLVEAK